MMKRRSVALVLLFFFLTGLYANVFNKPIDAFVYSTEHFDFIYPKESAGTVLDLSKHSENQYEQIQKDLGVETNLRLPVVVTPSKNTLNAYYSTAPYPRMVIYDTIAEKGDLVSLGGSLQKVFYHELAHAISLNIRTPFWQGVSDVLGSWVNPARWFYLNKSFVEGLAVAMEDMRLKDAFVRQILIQGKIEGLSPSWLDICGDMDIKPSGKLPYIYGGAFADYLIKTYGKPKYAEFINQASVIRFGLIGKTFSDVYSERIENVFDGFIQAIPEPENVINDGISLYSGLDFMDLEINDGIIYVADQRNSRIMKIDIATGKVSKDENMKSSEMRISFSDDGLKRSGSYVEEDYVFSEIRDLEVKFSQSKVFENLRRANLMDIGGRYFLAGVSFKDSRVSLTVYDWESGKELRNATLPFGWNIIDIAQFGHGLVFASATDGQEWASFIFDVQANQLWRVENPDNIHITDLHSDSKVLTFSYVEDENYEGLPKYGKLILQDDSVLMQLSSIDINGGVHNPILDNGKVYFIGRFFATDDVRAIEEDSLKLGESVELRLTEKSVVTQGNELDTGALIAQSTLYKPAFRKGWFIPYSTSYPHFLGVSYLTLDPTESYYLKLSGGYDPSSKLWGGSVLFQDTSYRLTFGLPIDLASQVTAAYFKPGKFPVYFWTNELSCPVVVNRFDGTELDIRTSFTLSSMNKAFGFQLVPSLALGRFDYSGNSVFEKRGYQLKATVTYDLNTVDFDFDAAFAVGNLIPVPNSGRFTYNLPLTLLAGINFGTTQCYFQSSLVLFNYEIQAAVPWMSSYFKRTYLSASVLYGYNLVRGSSGFAVQIDALLDFSPVFGVDIQNLNLQLYASYAWSSYTGSSISIGLRNPIKELRIKM